MFGTKASNEFYEHAAGRLKVFGGKYRLENCRENVIILILLGKAQEAQQLLSKLNSWYPHDERIHNLMEEFPYLEENLKKYAVSQR